MDIFSHGLWAGIAAKGLNRREKVRRINVWAMALWGVFPDMLSFTIPFVWLVWGLVFGGLELGQFGTNHPPLAEPLSQNTVLIYQISGALYNVSHSLIIFAAVFFAVWAYFRQARLELLGWLLHIVMDVPTHTYAFYPTPVFWPLFDWKFNGFQWGQWWFMILNYSLILLIYVWFLRRKKV